MKWQKSPDSVVQAFEHSLPIIDGVQRKPMYGHPCAYFNGHLFCGLHGDGIIVLLSDAGRERLLGEGAGVFEPTPGQPMKEYVVVPPEIIADRQRLRALLSDALAHVSSLAPKAEKGPAPVAKKSAPVAPKAAPARKASPAPKPAARKKVTAKKPAAKKKTKAKKAKAKAPPRAAKSAKKAKKANAKAKRAAPKKAKKRAR